MALPVVLLVRDALLVAEAQAVRHSVGENDTWGVRDVVTEAVPHRDTLPEEEALEPPEVLTVAEVLPDRVEETQGELDKEGSPERVGVRVAPAEALLVPELQRVGEGEVEGDFEREGLGEGVRDTVGDTHCVGVRVSRNVGVMEGNIVRDRV